MIIETYALHNLTREDAQAMHRELLFFFEKQKPSDFPQLAELLKNLSSLFNNGNNSK